MIPNLGSYFNILFRNGDCNWHNKKKFGQMTNLKVKNSPIFDKKAFLFCFNYRITSKITPPVNLIFWKKKHTN